jgi:hypothetical protein
MFIKQRVAHFGKWDPAFDDHETDRRWAGTTDHSLHGHGDVDHPNGVIIIAFRGASIARAREFVASDELRAAMERAGIEGPPEIHVIEDVEDNTY